MKKDKERQKQDCSLELNSDNFFYNAAIQDLRKMAGGDVYTSIYLKMQLESINSDGVIYFEGIENTLEKELALKLNEEEDNIEATLMFLKGYGLLKEISPKEFLLTKVPLLKQSKNIDTEKYCYLKLKDNFFDSEQMIILESSPDGYKYSNILLKLYLRSLKYDGKLMLNNTSDFQMLATTTRHNIKDIEKAIALFKDLKLIDVVNNELRLAHEFFDFEKGKTNECK